MSCMSSHKTTPAVEPKAAAKAASNGAKKADPVAGEKKKESPVDKKKD